MEKSKDVVHERPRRREGEQYAICSPSLILSPTAEWAAFLDEHV
jgi:hypothetical protein